jgi:hypothetical protein
MRRLSGPLQARRVPVQTMRAGRRAACHLQMAVELKLERELAGNLPSLLDQAGGVLGIGDGRRARRQLRRCSSCCVNEKRSVRAG